MIVLWPRWFTNLLALCLFSLLIALGFWQLHRAAFKQHLQTRYEQRIQLSPRPLSAWIGEKDPADYPVVITGRFVPQQTFLLDNKMMHHRPGYQVLSVFLPTSSQKAILVNRGWIPQGETRTSIPAIPTRTQTITLRGHLFVPPSHSFHLGTITTPSATTVWPLQIGWIDISTLAHLAGRPLYPFVVLLAADQTDGFERQWAPVDMKPEIHTAYAFQWFALAAAFFCLFFFTHIRRRK